MKYLLVFCLMALSVGTGFAHNSEQYQACSQKAKTQAAMGVCANETAKRADAELNRVYSELLSKAKSYSGALAKIRRAERAWIVYRDVYIEAMYPAKNKQAEYGSMFPMEADLLKARLTRQQIAALRAMLKKYSGM